MFFGHKKRNWPPGSHTCCCMALGTPGHTAAWGHAGAILGLLTLWPPTKQTTRSLAPWLSWQSLFWSALRLGQRSTIRTGAGLSTCSNLCKLGSSPKQLYGAAASYPAPFGHPRSMSLFGCPAYMQHPPLRVSNSDKSALNSTGIHNHKELRT